LVWGDSLAKGKARRDPDLGDLEISAGGLLAIGEGQDTKKLLDFVRPMIALYVGGMGAKGKNFYNTVARRYGYEEAAEKIQDLYLDGKKDEAAAAVPEEFVELTNMVGPESYVRERVEAFRAAGVTRLNVTPVGENPAALIEKVKGWVSGRSGRGRAVLRLTPGAFLNAGDPDPRVGLVAAVDRDEVGGEGFDLVGVAQASTEDAAYTRDPVGQGTDHVGGGAVLTENEHVQVHFLDLGIQQHLRGHVMEGSGDPAVDQDLL